LTNIALLGQENALRARKPVSGECISPSVRFQQWCHLHHRSSSDFHTAARRMHFWSYRTTHAHTHTHIHTYIHTHAWDFTSFSYSLYSFFCIP